MKPHLAAFTLLFLLLTAAPSIAQQTQLPAQSVPPPIAQRSPTLATEVPMIHSGDRWAVLGDSITHNGLYHRYIQLFYLTRFPGQSLELVNCGISGDSASGALKRLQWDCLDAKPTVVTVMFGMNDVGRSLYELGSVPTNAAILREEKAVAYDRSMREITKSLVNSGARVILIKPSPFDDTADLPRTNCPGLGEALTGFGRRVEAIAGENHLPTVDFSTPLATINREQQALDPHFTIIGPDRVHPGPPGHLVMAHQFLRTLKLSGVVSLICIDAPSGKAGPLENCEVSGLTCGTNGVSFTCLEKALPFPVDEPAKKGLEYVPFMQELNREMLTIHGLQPGDYRLSIDGQPIRSYSAAELAGGVNLAGEATTSQYRQSLRVLDALRRNWEAAVKLRTIALCEYSAWPDAAHPVDASQMPAKLDAWTNKVSKNTFLLDRAKQYPDLKAHEEDFKTQVRTALEEAVVASRPEPHRFEITRLASTSAPATTGLVSPTPNPRP